MPNPDIWSDPFRVSGAVGTVLGTISLSWHAYLTRRGNEIKDRLERLPAERGAEVVKVAQEVDDLRKNIDRLDREIVSVRNQLTEKMQVLHDAAMNNTNQLRLEVKGDITKLSEKVDNINHLQQVALSAHQAVVLAAIAELKRH